MQKKCSGPIFKVEIMVRYFVHVTVLCPLLKFKQYRAKDPPITKTYNVVMLTCLWSWMIAYMIRDVNYGLWNMSLCDLYINGLYLAYNMGRCVPIRQKWSQGLLEHSSYTLSHVHTYCLVLAVPMLSVCLIKTILYHVNMWAIQVKIKLYVTWLKFY